MMKTTTLTRHNLKDGMIVLIGDEKFYIHEAVHNNDDSTLIRGNFSSFWDYPSASHIFYDRERVKIVLEE